ncbi:MAG: peptide chain release factor-like protein [bacterium]|nr:peptide chain release factor-like protein [bacterium]
MEDNYFDERNIWLISEDIFFLKYCKAENFKSTGPGGQKKNKTSSAVRVTHIPTNLTATSDNYREQSINKKKAVKKLKIKIAINIRGPKVKINRPVISTSSNDYPLWIAKIFDIFNENKYDIRNTAKILELSTSKLIKLIYKDKIIWDIVNKNRVINGTYPLTPPRQ